MPGQLLIQGVLFGGGGEIFLKVQKLPVRADALQVVGRNLEQIVVAGVRDVGIVDVPGIHQQDISGFQVIRGFVDIGGHGARA